MTQKNVNIENQDSTTFTKKPIKPIKNVSVKQCVSTIIISLIALCVIFIPITFGNIGIKLTYKSLPLVGDGTLQLIQADIAMGFSLLINQDISSLVSTALNIGTIAFFVILLANILFSLILIITRSQICRIIFKTYTILAGFVMICILLLSLIHIGGIIGLIVKGEVELEAIMTLLEKSAILTMLGMAIMSGVLISKQFKWFTRLY